MLAMEHTQGSRLDQLGVLYSCIQMTVIFQNLLKYYTTASSDFQGTLLTALVTVYTLTPVLC